MGSRPHNAKPGDRISINDFISLSPQNTSRETDILEVKADILF